MSNQIVSNSNEKTNNAEIDKLSSKNDFIACFKNEYPYGSGGNLNFFHV